MTGRLVIITEIISPYRIPLFNALAENGEIDLRVIFLAETDPELRQWRVYKNEIRFSYEVLPSWRRRIAGYHALLNRGVRRALEAAHPDVILCGGYNYIASWQALGWAQSRSIPFVLWSESNLRDIRAGRALVEILKCEFLQHCSGFVVPGRSAREYLLAQGIKAERVFTAVNAIDSRFFAAAAASARERAAQIRTELKLPSRYFLFVGRLVREKGVVDLLSAYAKLDPLLREQVGLVFVGDGPCRKALEQESSLICAGAVRFSGFVQREELANYYALADVLVLPTHSDTWGLVVNEAMACGSPVIVSTAAGCAADLVAEGWNGFLVEAADVSGLSRAMQNLATSDGLRPIMGANSQERISSYSPEHWSAGIVCMMRSCRGVRD